MTDIEVELYDFPPEVDDGAIIIASYEYNDDGDLYFEVWLRKDGKNIREITEDLSDKESSFVKHQIEDFEEKQYCDS